MPAKRRRGKLDYGVWALARSANKDVMMNRRLAQIQSAAEAMGGAGDIANQSLRVLRDKSKAEGRGAYKLGKAIRKFGAGKFGQALQGSATMAAMGAMGVMGGSGMYTGAGEYTNDLINNGDANAVVPQFALESDEGICISKREYVSEIYGPPPISGVPGTATVPFSVQSFPLNPGLEGTFPWLSQIAMNYDEYELVQCIFTFKSTTTESTSSTNGQVGTIIMATNYNSAAPNFTDKVTMMQYAFANSERLTRSCQHGVECDPDKLSGSAGDYIRNNPVVVGQDLKTYDHGKFQIAVANCAPAFSNISIGELWVSYTVKLRKPKFYEALGLGISKDVFVSSGGETNTVLFGTNVLKGQQNNIGCLLTQPAASQARVTFPAPYKGIVKVMITCASGVLAGVRTAYTNCGYTAYAVTGNVSLVADLYGNGIFGGEVLDTPTGVLTYQNNDQGFLVVFHLRVDIATGGVDNTFTLTYQILSGGAVPSQAYVEVAEYNSGFSYSATGLAAVGNDAPVFINNGGVVTIPA